MSDISREQLLLWPFFEQLEKELSYERWIDKYRIFQRTLNSGIIPYDADWASFRQFCKRLYLQDHRDEARFDELLSEAIDRSEARLLQILLDIPVPYFLPFFERLEKELGYERDVDKFVSFQRSLAAGEIVFEADWSSFRQYCKQMFLQNIADEAIFDKILDEAIAEERSRLQRAIQRDPAGDRSEEKKEQGPSSDPASVTKDTTTDRPERTTTATDAPSAMPTPERATEVKYFHPVLSGMEENVDTQSQPLAITDRFLHTDEYFPTKRRELVKAWQYLRRRERGADSSRLDIPATVEHISRDGLFTQMLYEPAYVNRLDTLFLFADTRGSMTPFHELTRRLIETARGEGGHRRAPVYYFQNTPIDCLYRQHNLTESVPLKTSLLRANANLSYAFIISDAGAARGQKDTQQIDRRLRLLRPFLELLKANTAHIIWLNPMPEHRWEHTAAAVIAREPTITAMVPVLEEGNYNFQDVIRRIIKYKEV